MSDNMVVKQTSGLQFRRTLRPATHADQKPTPSPLQSCDQHERRKETN